jgi:hypothetical protein
MGGIWLSWRLNFRSDGKWGQRRPLICQLSRHLLRNSTYFAAQNPGLKQSSQKRAGTAGKPKRGLIVSDPIFHLTYLIRHISALAPQGPEWLKLLKLLADFSEYCSSPYFCTAKIVELRSCRKG